MLELLDAMSELVYVVNVDTYELLYMNVSGKKQFGIDSLDGLKCYKAIQGKDAPCEFCTTPFLKTDSYYTWERTNQLTGRHYLLKDKLFPWEGRQARIEIAFDLTEQKETLEAETLLVDCVESLQLGDSFCESAEEVLQKLGEFAEAERTYALEAKGFRVLKAYEWCAPGVQPRADRVRGLDFSACGWGDFFGERARIELSPLSGLACTGMNIRIAVVNPSPLKAPYLRIALNTLATFMSSVLQKERYERQLERLSFIDALTGVANSNAYTKDMEQQPLSSARPVGVAYLSINGFKEINDRNGREFGDRVLINTAQMLQSIMDPARVYRVGGDEFVAIWKGAESQSFETAIQKIKEWKKRELSAQFAMGYQWSDRCICPQELVKQAEEQMYLDKRHYYRGKVLPKRYRPASDQALGFAESGVLDRMLEKKKFLAYFQPKFAVPGREIIGAEALVRCLTDSGRLLPPDQFVPLLEETRLIGRVDFYMFNQVCSLIAEWIAQGRRVVPVSVNFSRYSLQEPWFHDTLFKIWEKHCIPKQCVEIEITESAEENCGDGLVAVIARLQQDGFAVSIDDFGVKYANLSVLTNCSFSTLKIDKSLVSDWENPRTGELLRMICEICRRIGMHLIAEGVETEEQFAFLQDIQCEGVQGYLFSQPLPLQEYERKYLTPLPAGIFH